MSSRDTRVVQLVIEAQRMLELRVRRLTPELGEAGDRRRDEAARQCRILRQAGDSVNREHARTADLRRFLSSVSSRNSEAPLQHRLRGDRPRVSETALLV